MNTAADNHPARPAPASANAGQRATARVPVVPAVLRWAVARSGKDPAVLRQRFAKRHAWELGETDPTISQLEAFAKATYLPMGYMFLREPPVEEMLILDLRTIDTQGVGHPGANLLDTIYICQRRRQFG